MKHSHLMLAAAAVTMLIPACNKTDGLLPDARRDGKAVSFNTYVSRTRATNLTAANISDFGVFAYHTGTEVWNDAALPDFMFNQQVSGSVSDGFSYTPVKYWPSSQNAKLTFFSYAPYATLSNGISLVTANTTAGYPKIKYALPSVESSQVDLLAATPVYDCTLAESGGSVCFNFNHVLSRIGFHVVLSGTGNYDGTSIYLNSIALTAKFPTSGVLDLGEGSWSEVVAGRDKQFVRNFGSGAEGLAVTAAKQEALGADGPVLSIPVEDLEMVLDVTYTIITPDAALESGSVSLVNNRQQTFTLSMQKGTSYDFLIAIGPRTVDFSAPVVGDWSTAEDSAFTLD